MAQTLHERATTTHAIRTDVKAKEANRALVTEFYDQFFSDASTLHSLRQACEKLPHHGHAGLYRALSADLFFKQSVTLVRH